MFLVRNKIKNVYVQVDKGFEPNGVRFPATIDRATKFEKRQQANYYKRKRKNPDEWEIIEVKK